MKVKVTVRTLYGYDKRECHLTVDFKNDLKALVVFCNTICNGNFYMTYEQFTPRQRARIVGFIQEITVDKFIN